MENHAIASVEEILQMKEHLQNENYIGLKELLEKNQNVLRYKIKKPNGTEINALIEVIKKKKKDMILLILGTTIGKEFCSNPDEPPLFHFIDNYLKDVDEDIFKRIFEHTNVNLCFGKSQWSFLMYSIKVENKHAFNHLFQYTNLNLQDKHKETAAHYAANCKDDYYLYMLCTKHVNLNIKNQNNNTPDMAPHCSSNKKQLIRKLRETKSESERNKILDDFFKKSQAENKQILPYRPLHISNNTNVTIYNNFQTPSNQPPMSSNQQPMSSNQQPMSLNQQPMSSSVHFERDHGTAVSNSSSASVKNRDKTTLPKAKVPSQSDDYGNEIEETEEKERILIEFLLPYKDMRKVMTTKSFF